MKGNICEFSSILLDKVEKCNYISFVTIQQKYPARYFGAGSEDIEQLCDF